MKYTHVSSGCFILHKAEDHIRLYVCDAGNQDDTSRQMLLICVI